MAGENVTTKFRVDISDLKKNIADANRQIKLAQAEFKNATAGTANWAESLDGLSAKITAQEKILEAEKKKLEALKAQQERLTKAQQDGQTVIDDLSRKHKAAAEEFGETSTEAQKLAKQLSDAEAAQKRNADAAENLRIKIVDQDTAVKNAASKVEEYRGKLKELENGSDHASDASDKLAEQVKDVGDSAEKASSGGISAFAVALGNLVSRGIEAAISGIKRLASAAKESYAEFDTGRDAVVKATGATGEAAKELQKSYAEVAKSVVGDFVDIGSALGEVNTRFGYTGKELEDATTTFLKFADITGTDATKAVQLVSRAMGDAGIDSSEYASVLDDLAIAAQASGISVDKLSELLTSYGAPMRALGFETRDAIAIFSQWEKAGVNTETAFSGMKAAIGKWSKEGKNAQVEFRKTLDEIAAAPNIASATTKAIEAFGQKAGPDLADAIQGGRFEFDEFLKIVERSEGTVENTFNETQDASDRVKLAFQGMKVSLGETVSEIVDKYGPDIERAVGKITPVIQKGISWIASNIPPVIEKVKGAFDAIAPVVQSVHDKIKPIFDDVSRRIKVAFGWIIDNKNAIVAALASIVAGFVAFKAVSFIQSIPAILTALRTAILGVNTALAANPVGIVIAAIAGLVAAFVLLWNKSETFRNFWIGLWDKIKRTVQPVIDWITGAFRKLWDVAKPIFDKIKGTASDAFRDISEVFASAWEAIKAAWDLVYPYFEAIWNGIKRVFEAVAPVLKAYFEAAWEWIKLVWDVAVKYFSMIWENIKVVFSAVKKTFVAWFSAAWEGIKFIWDTVTGYFKMVWENIKLIFKAVKAVLSGDFFGAWEAIKGIWDNVKTYFSGVWDGIKGVFSKVGSFFTTAFSEAWNAVKGIFGNVGAFFSGIWDTIKERFTSIGTKIGDAVGGAFKLAINAVLSTVENSINFVPSAINKALDLLNNLPGVNIPMMPTISLPRLAKGGITNGATVAQIGEAGTEAIIPLERNTGGLKRIAALLWEEMQKVPKPKPGAPSGAVAPAPQQTVNNYNSYNFSQTNNSPKALSRLEIYRQSRNLLAATQGVK